MFLVEKRSQEPELAVLDFEIPEEVARILQKVVEPGLQAFAFLPVLVLFRDVPDKADVVRLLDRNMFYHGPHLVPLDSATFLVRIQLGQVDGENERHILVFLDIVEE